MAKGTFKQDGDVITVTAGSAGISAGDVVKTGDIFGVAKFDIPASQQGVISTKGIFEFEKNATSDVYSQGGKIWYDTVSATIHPTSATSDCVQLGVATSAATSGGKIVEGKLK